MTNFKTLTYLLIIFFAFSCKEETPTFIDSNHKAEQKKNVIADDGSIKNGIYSNKEIGLLINLPFDWVNANHKTVMESWEAYNDSASYYKRIKYDLSESMTLFQSTYSTGESFSDVPCQIICIIEALDFYKNRYGKPCSNEQEYLKQFDYEYKNGSTNSDDYILFPGEDELMPDPIVNQSTEIINGVKFFTWQDKTIINKEENKNHYLKYYIKKTDKCFILIHTSYLDYKDCAGEIEKSIQSIKLRTD